MIECPVDEFVPLPVKRKPQPMAYKDIKERARAAVNAAVLLDMAGYEDTADMEFTKAVSHDMLRTAAQGHAVDPGFATVAMNTPEGCVYVDGLLSEYDREVVRDARRLRHYVTNKLIIESENMDGRIRMRALELLGKISDVGLFTERTEITVNNRSTVELENSLREKLRRLTGTSDAEEAKIIAPPIKASEPIDPALELANF
jgi:hypothetical protein